MDNFVFFKENDTTNLDSLSAGALIHTIRVDKGWTMEKLSKESGLSISAIQHIETGGSSPQIDKINTAFKALNVEAKLCINPL